MEPANANPEVAVQSQIIAKQALKDAASLAGDPENFLEYDEKCCQLMIEGQEFVWIREVDDKDSFNALYFNNGKELGLIVYQDGRADPFIELGNFAIDPKMSFSLAEAINAIREHTYIS